MNRFRALALAALAAFPFTTFASSAEDSVRDALEQARAASRENDKEKSRCQRKLGDELDSLVDSLQDAKKDPSKSQLNRALGAAKDASQLADDTCPGPVARAVNKKLGKVVASLETAIDAREEKATAKESSGGLGATLSVGINALGGLLGGQASSKTEVRQTSHSRSSSEELVNGKPMHSAPAAKADDDELEPPEPAAGVHGKKDREPWLGQTCNTNADCPSKTCFVGSGNLGYCTKICDSMECPFKWECKRAGNAPQKICQQDSW